MPTFEDYTRANLPGLLRLAGVLSHDRHTSEDIVQEVLFRASRRWDQINETAEPNAYVRRMVVNEYLSWRRKWSRIIPRPDVDSGDQSPDHADTVTERDDLTARLRSLPPRQHAVLVLRYYEGLSDTDIADALGCSPGSVRTAASRALASLRVTSTDTPLLSRSTRKGE